MSIKSLLTACAALLACAIAPAHADIGGWTGEGSLSAAVTTGNTETTDVGAGLKAARQFGDWRAKGDAMVDYGETEDVETRNRLAVGAQLDRDFTDRLYAYGRGSYASDEFSSFDRQIFAGVGAGYKVLTGDVTKWTLEAGPGYRWDELSNGEEEESFAARGASAFSHAFNDNVGLFNNTEVTYADVSTQIFNSLGLTAKLTEAFAARVSYDVRHETDALPGREETDTATRVSLVYGF